MSLKNILCNSINLINSIIVIFLMFFPVSVLASDCSISTKGISGIDIFPNYPKQGSVLVTLHPGEKNINKPLLKFGVPFPVNVVSDVKKLKIIKNGKELPSHIEVSMKWREFDSDCEYIRSVQVVINNDDSFAKMQTLEIKWGETRSNNLEADVAEASLINATLPAKYLGECMLRVRTIPVHENSKNRFWKEYNHYFLGYSQTAITDFDLDKYAAWQLERDSAIWNVYIRTGELSWLKEAIKNTKSYAENIRTTAGSKSDGSFRLRDPKDDQKRFDKKYAYGQGILNLYMLTGEGSYTSKIHSISNLVSEIDIDYTSGDFFTERHIAYALLGALNEWELSADEKSKNRAIQIVTNLRSMQDHPENGWSSIGAPLHRIRDHEGCNDGQSPVSSPWMGSLLAEAVWRYYIFSGDREALLYISKYGDFVVDYGLTTIEHAKSRFNGHKTPHYLASDEFTSAGGNSCKNGSISLWHNGNIEHAPDVLGLLIRSKYAKRILEEETTEITKEIKELKKSTLALFKFWNRETFEPKFKITPPRKYNWWFQAHSDIGYLDTL